MLAPDAVEAATLFVDRGTNDGPALLASAEGRPSGADGPGGGGPGAVTGGVPGGVPGGVVGGSPPGVPGGTGDAPGLTPASFAPSRPSAGAGNGGGAERQPPRPVVRHKAEAAPVGPAAASPPAPAAAPAPHAAAPQPERDAPAPALARPSEPKDPPAAKPAPADDLPERPRPTARPRPDGLRSEKLTSRVPLRVHIAVSADGHITSVSVSSSCGDSAIDDRVCSFVRREWRFSRARQGGSFSQTFQVQPAEPR
ncbi:MAG: TonB family protein [Armatimonadetes bacterium]|nr:TonB family protein [Armatimonadota bacterium]